MTFAWGFQDSANNTHTSEMLGFEFESNSQPYSIDNLGQAIGVFVFFIIEAFVYGQKPYIIFNFACGVLGVIMNLTTLGFDFKPRVQDMEEPRESEVLAAMTEKKMQSIAYEAEEAGSVKKPD